MHTFSIGTEVVLVNDQDNLKAGEKYIVKNIYKSGLIKIESNNKRYIVSGDNLISANKTYKTDQIKECLENGKKLSFISETKFWYVFAKDGFIFDKDGQIMDVASYIENFKIHYGDKNIWVEYC